MAGHKLGRITEDVKRELTAILREVKDPRVKDCFLSVVRVEVTNDLSYCTVYVLSLIHISPRQVCSAFRVTFVLKKFFLFFTFSSLFSFVQYGEKKLAMQ